MVNNTDRLWCTGLDINPLIIEFSHFDLYLNAAPSIYKTLTLTVILMYKGNAAIGSLHSTSMGKDRRILCCKVELFPLLTSWLGDWWVREQC